MCNNYSEHIEHKSIPIYSKPLYKSSKLKYRQKRPGKTKHNQNDREQPVNLLKSWHFYITHINLMCQCKSVEVRVWNDDDDIGGKRKEIYKEKQYLYDK